MKDTGERKLRIGRSGECDIVLNQNSVSASHAEISWVDGRAWLKDLDSTNGTYLDGSRINNCQITAGQSVSFGTARYLFDGNTFISDMGQQSGNRYGIPTGDSTKNQFQKMPLSFKLLGVVLIALIGLGVFKFATGLRDMTVSEISRSTVFVIMSDESGDICWSGSGAVILGGKYIVTNAHVADTNYPANKTDPGCKVLNIGLNDKTGRNVETWVGASLAASDIPRDLAILEMDTSVGADRTSLSFREGNVSLGEDVRVFGYPDIGGETLTLSSGIISGLDESESFPFYKVTADIFGHGLSRFTPTAQQSG